MKKRNVITLILIGLLSLVTIIVVPACFIKNKKVSLISSEEYAQMENLDRGLVAVNGNWNNTYLSWRLLGDEDIENQAFDIYRNGVLVHTTEPHDATQWNDYDNPPIDAYYQVVPKGESVLNAKKVRTLNTVLGGTAVLDIKFDMPEDDIQQTSQSQIKLDENGNPISKEVIDPDTGEVEIIYETEIARDLNGDVILVDRLDEDGKQIHWKYSVDDITTGDLDGDGEYELVVMFYGSTQRSWPGYSSPVIIRGIDVDFTTGENKLLWEINCGRNICAGTHYNPILVYDFDGDGIAEMFMKTAPGVKDGTDKYVSNVGKGYYKLEKNGNNVTESDELFLVKDIDNSRYYGDPDFGCTSGPELLTVFDGKTGKALQTIGYEADWNYPPKWQPGTRDGGKPRWGDYAGNRSERFLATVAYLDGIHPSAVMTRGLYSYVYLTAYDFDGVNITQRWLSENNYGGVNSSGEAYGDYLEMDLNYGADSTTPITIANNVVWYGNDLYNKTTRNYTTSTKTAFDQGNHSLAAADVDNDGKQEVVYGGAVIDDNGVVLYSTGRGHGDAHHVSDYNNDGKIEVYSVHEHGPGVDITQYDSTNSNGYKDIYWSGDAGWDIGRGMAGNLDDDFALKNNVPSVTYSIMNGNLYNTLNGNPLNGGGNALTPNSNGVIFMDFTIYWDGDLGVELLDGLSSGAPVIANHTLTANADGTVSSRTDRILPTKQLNFYPDVSMNNGTKHVPSLTADILGDWREEMLYKLNDLNGDGYGDGIRMYMTCDHTSYRIPTLMHDLNYRCQVSSENVGYNQPPHTSYYIGSLALAKDSDGNTLNYLDPTIGFSKIRLCNKDYSKLNEKEEQSNNINSKYYITEKKWFFSKKNDLSK